MSYEDNRAFSDMFIPAIKRIIGPLLLDVSSLEVDVTKATDLVLRVDKSLAIACRVRAFGYAAKYPWEFTIRSSTKYGGKTELYKILREGHADWCFYGHQAGDLFEFSRWFLLDLGVFRNCHADWNEDFSEIPSPGGNRFVSFDVRRHPASMIIAASHAIPLIK